VDLLIILVKIIEKFFSTIKNHSGLGVILTAALLLELIAGVEYWYTHKLVVNSLERRAESELTMKAILIRGTLNALENVLKDHAQDVASNKSCSDSMFAVANRFYHAHPDIMGGGIGFEPYYYPERGRLFEPWAGRNGDSLSVLQLSSDNHDYTKMPFYRQALERGGIIWSDPYIDEAGNLGLITTASLAVYDSNKVAYAVMGADVSLSWLGDTINNRHIYPSSFVLLLTEGGELIAGPSEKHAKNGSVNDVVTLVNDSSIARTQSKSKRTKVIKFKDDKEGRDGYVYYANMRGYPHWQLAVICYDDEVFGSLNKLSWNILLLSLFGLLVLGYILYRSAKNINRLHEATVEKERINGELHIAKEIQKEMLPKLDSLHSCRDVSICGLLEPAREVGGDLYDFFVRDEKLFFCIGDVSGKGVPSALVMTVTHSLFRSTSSHETNPARIMRILNEAACEHNDSNMFVTLFIGVLDLPKGRLRYCNAGHDKPIILDGSVRELPTKANMPIGLFSDFNYEMQEELLGAGWMMFLYTDGLTEARNPKRLFYGQKRVLNALSECGNTENSPEELLRKMNENVHEFMDKASQSDDLTMLALRYTPSDEHILLQDSLSLTNDVKEVEKLSQFVKSLTHRLGMNKSLASSLRLSIEEAVVNVMNYAYPENTEGMVKLEVDVSHNQNPSISDLYLLKVKIIDNGIPFDPTEVAEADTTLSVENRPIGGLGIFVLRKLMDTINYEYENGQNVLTLKKHFTPESKDFQIK